MTARIRFVLIMHVKFQIKLFIIGICYYIDKTMLCVTYKLSSEVIRMFRIMNVNCSDMYFQDITVM